MTTINLAGHGDRLPESLGEGNPNMADRSRLPYVPYGYTAVLEEPGRRIAGENRLSYNFAIAKGEEMKDYVVFLRTGSGQQDFRILNGEDWMDTLLALPSDQRFSMLMLLYGTHVASTSAAEERMRTAFMEGRLKKSKIGGMTVVDVLPKVEGVAA